MASLINCLLPISLSHSTLTFRTLLTLDIGPSNNGNRLCRSPHVHWLPSLHYFNHPYPQDRHNDKYSINDSGTGVCQHDSRVSWVNEPHTWWIELTQVSCSRHDRVCARAYGPFSHLTRYIDGRTSSDTRIRVLLEYFVQINTASSERWSY